MRDESHSSANVYHVVACNCAPVSCQMVSDASSLARSNLYAFGGGHGVEWVKVEFVVENVAY